MTTITLILKTQCPKGPGNYQSISCCNVIYKYITKLICSRLKLVLGAIISPNQGAFAEGCSFLHNILLCQDVVKHYGKRSCMPSCLINMDLRKDYDTLNWDFLKDMMTTLNFPTWFVKRVMTCVSSSQYSLIMHGNPLKPFKAKRGVRRGNPMSPLLFVIGMKYLLRILKAEDEVEDFKFHPRCSTLKLNHLVFANDLILFCKGDTQSIQTLYQGV